MTRLDADLDLIRQAALDAERYLDKLADDGQ